MPSGLFVFIPLIDEGTETAQGFLRVLVNGDIDDGGRRRGNRNGRSFVQIAADLVLRIDVDDDDIWMLFRDFVCQDSLGTFRHIKRLPTDCQSGRHLSGGMQGQFSVCVFFWKPRKILVRLCCLPVLSSASSILIGGV